MDGQINEAYLTFFDYFIKNNYNITVGPLDYSNTATNNILNKKITRINNHDFTEKWKKDNNYTKKDRSINKVLVLPMLSIFKYNPWMLKSIIYDQGDFLGVVFFQRFSIREKSSINQLAYIDSPKRFAGKSALTNYFISIIPNA